MDERRTLRPATPPHYPRYATQIRDRDLHHGPPASLLRHAATVLQEQHHVSEANAFAILVEGAVEAGTSVREVAYAVIAGSIGWDEGSR